MRFLILCIIIVCPLVSILFNMVSLAPNEMLGNKKRQNSNFTSATFDVLKSMRR